MKIPSHIEDAAEEAYNRGRDPYEHEEASLLGIEAAVQAVYPLIAAHVLREVDRLAVLDYDYAGLIQDAIQEYEASDNT